MSSNVTKFPDGSHLIDQMRGAELSGSRVIVDGRSVPKMTMHETDTHIEFILDGRMAWAFPKSIAAHVVSFAANAMAIGAGWPCFTAEKKTEHFATPYMMLEELPPY